MLVVFAGGMVANGLLGEPMLAPLKNNQQILVATLAWWENYRVKNELNFVIKITRDI